MKISFNRTFLKDLAKIPNPIKGNIEQFVFEDIHAYQFGGNSFKIEKLTGYKHYYKIRFGNYRVGIRISDNELIFERVLHRKEIYKFFP